MSKVLVTGSAGFIGGYVVAELLSRGHEVVGLDNLSKYGRVAKSYDDDARYRLVEGDARDTELLAGLLAECDHLIAGAAMIGGISYFHAYAYDLLATNERIIAATCDAAIQAHLKQHLEKVTYISSSMVFESTNSWPSFEGQEHEFPRPARRTVSRSWRSSTSPARPGTSIGSRTPSSARSTAWVSARRARSATSRC